MWDVWHAREPEALFTFTVLTTFPNEYQRQSTTVCRRSSSQRDYERSLDSENEEVADILTPYPAEGMITYPVSTQPSEGGGAMMSATSSFSGSSQRW